MEAFHTNTRNHSWLARGRVPNPGTIHGLHTPSYHLYVCATH